MRLAVRSPGGSAAGALLKRPVLVIRVEELAGCLRKFPVPVQFEAQRHQVRQQVVQLGDAAALGMVGGQYGDIFLVFKGGSGEGAQDAFGAALYKYPHAVGVHALKLFYEFNRARHLFEQQVVGTLFVGREIIRGHVGQERYGPRSGRDVFQEFPVRPDGGLYDGRVKSVRHGYLLGLYAQGHELGHGFFHGDALARYHGLQRAVLVGAYDIAVYFF